MNGNGWQVHSLLGVDVVVDLVERQGWKTWKPKKKTWDPVGKTWDPGGRACSDLITTFHPLPSSKIHSAPVFLNKPTKGWVGDGAFPRNGWRMDNKDFCPDEETESDDKIWNGKYLVEEWWLYEGDWDDTSSHYLPWFATCQLSTLLHWQLIVLRFILSGRSLLDNSLLVSWFKCYNIDLRPRAVLRCAAFALQKKSNIWALPSPVPLKRLMLDHKLFTNISLAVSLPTVAVHCSTLFRFSSYHPSHRSHFSPFPLMWTC